jgi:hypothetical protein
MKVFLSLAMLIYLIEKITASSFKRQGLNKSCNFFFNKCGKDKNGLNLKCGTNLVVDKKTCLLAIGAECKDNTECAYYDKRKIETHCNTEKQCDLKEKIKKP